MGIFQIAAQGLNPIGQVETGLVVPLIGARQATFFGGSTVWLITMTDDLALAILPIDHTQARCETNAETKNGKAPMFCRLAVKFLAVKLA